MPDRESDQGPPDFFAKRSEQAIDAHLFRALLDSVPDHVYFKDTKSRFVRISKAMASWFGLDGPAAAVGLTDFDFFTEEHARPAFEDEQEIIRTGRPLVGIEEKETWPDGHETWAWTTKMPLRDEEGRIIGTFGISSDITERKLAQAERDRLWEALERRSTQLQAAAEVSHVASSILDPDELIRQVVDLVGEGFDLYYVGLFLVDESGHWTGEPGRWVVLQAATGEAGRILVDKGHKLAIDDTSMVGWCVARGQARVSPDVSTDAAHLGNQLLPETRSEMVLPLVVGKRVIGALDVQSRRVSAFDENDVLVFQTMADQLAVAIENARAVDEMRRLNDDLQRTLETQEQLIETIRELSTPVAPLLKGVILLPLVGQIDSARAQQIMDEVLRGVQQHRARIVILDVTGVAMVDTAVANSLLQAAQAVQLLGAETVLVGVRPEVAQTIVGLGVDLSTLITVSDLQGGIEYALRRMQ